MKPTDTRTCLNTSLTPPWTKPTLLDQLQHAIRLRGAARGLAPRGVTY